MTAEDVKRLSTCPGPGGCGGILANTMATAIRVLGIGLPGSSSHPAESADRKKISKQQGVLLLKITRLGLKPSIS